MCVCARVHALYVRVHTCVYVCVRTCMCIACMHVCASVHAGVHVCVRVCMHTCGCVCIDMICIMCMRAYVCVHMYVCVRASFDSFLLHWMIGISGRMLTWLLLHHIVVITTSPHS